METEFVSLATGNRGILRHFLEETLRRIRVNLFRDKGVYDIPKNRYFSEGMKVVRFKRYAPYSFSSVVKDGLWSEDYGEDSYPSLYLLDITLSKRKENIWEVWKFHDRYEGFLPLKKCASVKEEWKPWGTGWFLLSLQATCISWKKFTRKVESLLVGLLIIMFLIPSLILIYV